MISEDLLSNKLPNSVFSRLRQSGKASLSPDNLLIR